MQLVEQLFDLAGIGKNRMGFYYISAAEGQLFAKTVKELTQATQEMGPFDPDQYKLQLGAVETALRSPRLRWLTGVDRHLTERGNVYNQKVDEDYLHNLMGQILKEEYEKALLLEALKPGPQSVREMSAKTGLPVYTVSLRLNDLERRGLAELKGYDGSTPKFIRLAA